MNTSSISILSRLWVPSPCRSSLLRASRPTTVRRWLAAEGTGRAVLAPGPSDTTTSTLHTALQSAVKWGLLARYPAGSGDASRPRRQDMHTLVEDGIATFLEAARETPYYALFYLALYTGMRRSELLALR